MKETYKIKRPDHIVFGDPLYFEQFKGARLKKLVTDYHVLTKFDTARLVLEEKSFSNCPDMMNRTMTLYFAQDSKWFTALISLQLSFLTNNLS